MKYKIILISLLTAGFAYGADTCKSATDAAEDLSNQGSWAKATETAKKAVKLCETEKQKTARPHMILATVSNAVQDYEQTIFWSKEALKQEPDLPLAYMDMCAGYMNMEKYDEAVTACKNGLKRDNPWSAKINFNTGMALFKKYVGLSKFEKTAEAEPYFKASEKLDPKILDNYYYLGLITQTNGKNAEALEQFTKGCELGHKKCCEAKSTVVIQPAPNTTKPTAAAAKPAGPVSADEEKLWEKIRAGYLKKGVPPASIETMLTQMKANFVALPVEQRMTTLKSMADQL